MKYYQINIWTPHSKIFFWLHCSILLPHHWCISGHGWSSQSSPTPDHSECQDQIQGSSPNSSPSASLCSGSGPPAAGPQSQPQSQLQPPFQREGTQTHLDVCHTKQWLLQIFYKNIFPACFATFPQEKTIIILNSLILRLVLIVTPVHLRIFL